MIKYLSGAEECSSDQKSISRTGTLIAYRHLKESRNKHPNKHPRVHTTA